MTGAVAGAGPNNPRSRKAVGERGTASAVPSNPDNRASRVASPIEQGRVAREQLFIGIDVSKDRLDVHVRPWGETFVVVRDGEGLSALMIGFSPCRRLLSWWKQLAASRRSWRRRWREQVLRSRW
jgi:transposase